RQPFTDFASLYDTVVNDRRVEDLNALSQNTLQTSTPTIATEENITCKICLEYQIGIVLIPCGHLACSDCALKINTCSICRIYNSMSKHSKIITMSPSAVSGYTTFNERLATFRKDWNTIYPVSCESLAEAGFYSYNLSDRVVSFCCYRGLSGWRLWNKPWETHALWSPNCQYVIDKKGKKFIQKAIRKSPKQLPKNTRDLVVKEWMGSDMAYSILALKITTFDILRQIMFSRYDECKKPFAYFEELREAIYSSNLYKLSNFCIQQQNNENPTKEIFTCKICMINEIKIVFVPCGHQVACRDCASKLQNCCICRTCVM
ncbi:unnamed protein product, partial [Medioppia subpectinata]